MKSEVVDMPTWLTFIWVDNKQKKEEGTQHDHVQIYTIFVYVPVRVYWLE